MVGVGMVGVRGKLVIGVGGHGGRGWWLRG